MSSFEGRMKEYPYVSLDRFDKENLHARAYFLSHCHKDHMKGLKRPALKRKLKFSLTVKLYCSPVTKELLLSNPKYSFWENHIVALELENPTQISLVDESSGEKEDVVVTLLPAGHCPGSVMFLIEGQQGTVLYTGDFRLAEGEASRMEFLHTGTRVKDIQSVYLDTTFFDPRYLVIPSREVCLRAIRDVVKDWVTRSPYHVVWLNCKAAYGYEYLFTSLCEEFDCQVHINSTKMFKMMPDILCHVTTNRATQIHACRHPKGEEYIRGKRLPCGRRAPNGNPLHIISIKPSTIWFGERTERTSVVVKMGHSSYRACFSFHSSYSEIKDFLSYICPVNIYPNVIPVGRTLQEVQEMLKPLCREYSRREFVVYKPLGTLKKAKVEYTSKCRNSDSECDLFDEEDLTPYRRKVPRKWKTDGLGLPVAQKTPPPTHSDEEHQPDLNLEQLQENYVECTESNDDEDDEEDSDEDEPPPASKFSYATTDDPDPETPCSHEEQNGTAVGRAESPLPKWEAFFKADPPLTDESLEPGSSQSQKQESSQSLVLFSESDDDSTHVSSQSTNISDPGAESQFDTILLPMEERTELLKSSLAHAENPRSRAVLVGMRSAEMLPLANKGLSDPNNKVRVALKTPPEEKSDSQVSSDFEIPPTPESEVPRVEDLKELYRKLAAGEELVIKRSGQGTV